MLKVNEFLDVLNNFAPLSLSEKMIEKGNYDNSGLLIKTHDEVKKVLFTMELSKDSLKRAKRLGCDSIITHHPAIYAPIKSLSIDNSETEVLVKAIESKINIFSYHLNLDIAENGIDANLCYCLGGKKYKIIDLVDEKHGYGREFSVTPTTFIEYTKNVKKIFLHNVVTYGNKKDVVKNVASFCGAGGNEALKAILNGLNVDTIVSSDMPQHIIKALVERNIKVILLPHYSCEEYGFNVFFKEIEKNVVNKVETLYYKDKRFM